MPTVTKLNSVCHWILPVELVKMALKPKRVRPSLNLKQNIEILSKLDEGILGSVMAKKYGFAESTI